MSSNVSKIAAVAKGARNNRGGAVVDGSVAGKNMPPGGYQRSYSHSFAQHTHNHNKRQFEREERIDPELEAELALAKENGGLPPPSVPATGKSKQQQVKPGYKRQTSEVLTKVARALELHVGECDDTDDSDDDDSGGEGVDKLIHSKAAKNGVGGNGKAERKARSRGVSGCSIKKDGGRFELGLDMAFEEPFSNDSTDLEAEYDQYADYHFKYSDKEIRTVLQDYFVNGNKEEALASLEKFKITHDALGRMTKDLIQLTVETPSSATLELGGQLLEEIVRLRWISASTLIDVIREVVESLQELSVDCPKVVEDMSVLMAKLIERRVITVEAVRIIALHSAANSDRSHGGEGKENSRVAQQCYEDALTFASNRALLNGKLAPSGGHQPIEVLSAQFKLILKEFLTSHDKEAASLRIEELKAKHFNHEFVYQTGVVALERMHDTIMKKLAELLKYMFENGVLVETCLRKGYERLYVSLGDLFLDLPAAYALAKRWVSKSLKEGLISCELAEQCPERARSRTLSEGPDGKLSVEDGDPSGLDDDDAIHNHHNGHATSVHEPSNV